MPCSAVDCTGRMLSFQSSSSSGPAGPKSCCGCKGIRTCRLCSKYEENVNTSNKYDEQRDEENIEYNYCLRCKKVYLSKEPITFKNGTDENQGYSHSNANKSEPKYKDMSLLSSEISVFGGEKCGPEHIELSCDHSSTLLDFKGIEVIEDFVSPSEEVTLKQSIFETPFVDSQSGRRKQDFGPKVNFKKKKLRIGNFYGLPAYSQELYKRMKTFPLLDNFEPVELCNLEYCEERGAHIDPHFDDSWVWGERLVTLNLVSDSTLTFSCDSKPGVLVQIPLKRRSLLIVSSDARYQWKHAIDPSYIKGKRLAMTFRELSEEFSCDGDRADEGDALLQLALTFKGCSIVS